MSQGADHKTGSATSASSYRYPKESTQNIWDADGIHVRPLRLWVAIEKACNRLEI